MPLNVLLVTLMVSLAPTRVSAPPRPRVAVLPENVEVLMVVGPNSESNPPPQSFQAPQPAAVLFRNLVLVTLRPAVGKEPVQPPPSGAQPKKSTAPPR